jgi:hypothetical protein
VDLVEKITKLRRDKDPWIIIDQLVDLWAKIAPDEENAQKIQINEYREQLIDPKFGQTAGGKHFERRFTIAIPQRLMLMIRSQYKPDELKTDAKFYQKFAKRYPFFKISEKI